MIIYETNSALGYNQLAFLIRLDQTKEGHDYLVIGKQNIPSHDDYYVIGEKVEDLEDYLVKESEFKIEDSPLYNEFLFKAFIKDINN